MYWQAIIEFKLDENVKHGVTTNIMLRSHLNQINLSEILKMKSETRNFEKRYST